MNYLQQAFETTLKDAEHPETWYCCLVERQRVYAGPWEGGTWVDDVFLVAWKQFPSEELAQAAYKKIINFAKELGEKAQRSYGDQCLREMAWLEARGLDADFLPEPDGPSEFNVIVTNSLEGIESRGCRQYS